MTPKPGSPRPNYVLRDCLGPGAVKRPHRFWSTSRRHRRCGKCEERVRDMAMRCGPAVRSTGRPQ